ncbi:MAG: hypothetical protein AAGK97_10765, partial [Bacteroidota bacterium]
MHKYLFCKYSFLALLSLASMQVWGATYTVNSTLDDGSTGTLRWAIGQANSNPGADIIDFNIPGTGPHTITLASGLPFITGDLTIDGSTQAGAVIGTVSTAGVIGFDLQIIIDCINVTTSNPFTHSGNITVTHNAINYVNFARGGGAILLAQSGSSLIVNNCIFHLDNTGSNAVGGCNDCDAVNVFPGAGQSLSANNNAAGQHRWAFRVGGPGVTNTITNNWMGATGDLSQNLQLFEGIAIRNSANSTITGNIILNATGNGIGINSDNQTGPVQYTIQNNWIAGGADGIEIFEGSGSASGLFSINISNNILGLDAAGSSVYGTNANDGIYVRASSSSPSLKPTDLDITDNLVGGFNSPGRHGVRAEYLQNSSNTIDITLNYIGTNASNSVLSNTTGVRLNRNNGLITVSDNFISENTVYGLYNIIEDGNYTISSNTLNNNSNTSINNIVQGSGTPNIV